MPTNASAPVVVVTGAASGIGRATALRMARSGAAVWAADVREIHEPGPLRAVVLDVRDEAGWDALVAAVLAEHDRIDALAMVHGVVAGLRDTVVGQIRPEWDRVLAVNCTGTWLGMRAVIPSMVDRGGGSIVCTSSATAVGGTPELAAYAASKGAVISMARQAAAEYGPRGVRVNVVAPGVIDTPLVANAPAPFIRSVQEATPLGRVGTPDEVAGAIEFLCLGDSGFVTGEVFAVDGGLLASAVAPSGGYGSG